MNPPELGKDSPEQSSRMVDMNFLAEEPGIPFIERLAESKLLLRPAKDCSPWPLSERPGINLSENSDMMLAAFHEPLRTALVDRTNTEDEDANAILDLLTENKIAFVELTDDTISPALATAKEVFEADKAGVGIRTEVIGSEIIPGSTRSILDSFPALERDGKKFRLMLQQNAQNPDAIVAALSQLALPSEAKMTDLGLLAITELVDDAERPSTISQQELEDWLDRLKTAGIKLDVDISDDDLDLDNFLRYEGKLYWCDGDIMLVQALPQDQVEAQLDSWRKSLSQHLNPV